MLDLSIINKRYFEVKIGGTLLEVEPPKVKSLKKLLGLSRGLTSTDGGMEEEIVDELTEAVAGILSKNKKKKKIDIEFVGENLDIDSMVLVLEKYFEWVSEIQKDPN